MNRRQLNEFDTEAVRRSFEQAANGYDRHAVLQQEVGQRLLERLEYLRAEPAHVLDAGCGTGLIGHELSRQFPMAQVIGLDWSTGMLHQLKQRGGSAPTPHALCGDMHGLPLAARSMDVVFSNLAIQWSVDPRLLFAEIRRVLKPGGMLLFSTFGPDTLHELRSAWAQADDRPHVNQFADMHDVGDLVVASGFVEPVFDVDIITLEYSEVTGLMRDLKAIGAHNSVAGRSSGLTGKEKFKRVLAAYEVHRREGKYPATYEVIYGVAFGPKEGQPVRTPTGDMVTFSVDALKSAGKDGNS